MKPKLKNKLLFLAFFILISAPLVLQIMGVRIDLALSGVSSDENQPSFSVENAMDGTFQSEIDAWYKKNLSIKDLLVRSGNQFLWSAFHTTSNDNLTVGADNIIYEMPYIDCYFQYYSPILQSEAEELVAKLENIQSQCEARGKKLFIFITPMKTTFYNEEVPWAYRVCQPERQTSSYDQFTAALKKSTLHYYDSVPFVQSLYDAGTEVYSKTGVHWTQSTGALVATQVRNALCEQLGYDLNDYEVKISEVENPVYPDADIFNTMNVFTKPYDSYTEPTFELIKTGADHPSAFFRGGSFMGQSLAYLIRGGTFNSDFYMENSFFYKNAYSSAPTFFSSYSEIDLRGMLDAADLVVLEVNQNAIHGMSFGLIEEILDKKLLQ